MRVIERDTKLAHLDLELPPRGTKWSFVGVFSKKGEGTLYCEQGWDAERRMLNLLHEVNLMAKLYRAIRKVRKHGKCKRVHDAERRVDIVVTHLRGDQLAVNAAVA